MNISMINKILLVELMWYNGRYAIFFDHSNISWNNRPQYNMSKVNFNGYNDYICGKVFKIDFSKDLIPMDNTYDMDNTNEYLMQHYKYKQLMPFLKINELMHLPNKEFHLNKLKKFHYNIKD